MPDQKDPRGGPRPGAGRHPLPEGTHRVNQAGRFHPDTRPLAEAIAARRGYLGWSRAVDEAVRRLAQELGIIDSKTGENND